MKIIETRTINWNDLRNLCIDKDWYTSGTIDDYASMLDFVGSNKMTTDNLVSVATDIIKHTDAKCFKDCEANGTTALRYVLFELANIAHTFFHDENEDFINGKFVEVERRG